MQLRYTDTVNFLIFFILTLVAVLGGFCLAIKLVVECVESYGGLVTWLGVMVFLILVLAVINGTIAVTRRWRGRAYGGLTDPSSSTCIPLSTEVEDSTVADSNSHDGLPAYDGIAGGRGGEQQDKHGSLARIV